MSRQYNTTLWHNEISPKGNIITYHFRYYELLENIIYCNAVSELKEYKIILDSFSFELTVNEYDYLKKYLNRKITLLESNFYISGIGI